MATHSNILAWEIPWIKETYSLLSIGSQRVWTHLKQSSIHERVDQILKLMEGSLNLKIKMTRSSRIFDLYFPVRQLQVC